MNHNISDVVQIMINHGIQYFESSLVVCADFLSECGLKGIQINSLHAVDDKLVVFSDVNGAALNRSTQLGHLCNQVTLSELNDYVEHLLGHV